MDLKGKVAIVTGGGTGMGKAIATLLAAADAHVVVHSSRSEAIATAQADSSWVGSRRVALWVRFLNAHR
jgi:3-oxoacyl-[acyl-carrier protein] reductase